MRRRPRASSRLLRVGTWNMGPAAAALVLRDLYALAKRCDVILLQEAGDRGPLLALFVATRPWWGLYRPKDEPGQSHTPLLYRRGRLRLHSASTSVAVESRTVGPVGAGPSTLRAKHTNQLLVEHRASSWLVAILNVHMIASATRGDLPDAEQHKRRRHYVDHINALCRAMAPGVAHIVGGDLNAPATYGPLAQLSTAGLRGWSTEGTHGARAIDHVLHDPLDGVDVVGREYVTTCSDHRAVVATYQVPA